ncbi:hypothetical protein ACIA5C_19795 [Actinoplanes sp. NPDC051343]|uniref:hypothetical protein n=1 Tax=Actinoplanes sp. NPDC051343 TaxID=3363906 RepID=UPI00379DCBD2
MGGEVMGGRGSRGRALPQPGWENGPTTPAPAPAEQSDWPDPVAKPPATPGDRIRDVYTDLAGSEGRWIDLTEVRARLDGLPREEVDAALRDLIRDDRVRLEPEPFGHRIGPAEREAAIHIGGEDRHKLWIEPAPAPAGTEQVAGAANRPLGDRVREAYGELKTGGEGLVSLAQLRDKLPDVSRAELDETLLEMDRRREAQLEPDPHRIALTDRAKDAAIFLGGEDMHLIVIDTPRNDEP